MNEWKNKLIQRYIFSNRYATGFCSDTKHDNKIGRKEERKNEW